MSFFITEKFKICHFNLNSQAKKSCGGQSVKKQSTLRDAKSPESSISSNPSSPVSSTKSSPQLISAKSLQKKASNKLQAARAANQEQKLKSSVVRLKRSVPIDDADLSLSPASSKQSESFSSPSEAPKSVIRLEKVSTAKKSTPSAKAYVM